MSDAHHRYTGIGQAAVESGQPCPTGHQKRRVNTLAAMSFGLAGGEPGGAGK